MTDENGVDKAPKNNNIDNKPEINSDHNNRAAQQKKEEHGVNLRKIIRGILIPAFIAIVCFLINYFITAPYVGKVLEWRSYDLMVAMRNNPLFSGMQNPSHRRNPDIVVVPIDDDSYKSIKEPTFFWTPYYAMVIENLLEGGAKTISLDFQFSISSDKYLNEKIVKALQKVLEEKKVTFDEEEAAPYLEKDDEKFFSALRMGQGRVVMMSYLKEDRSFGAPYTPYAYAVGFGNLALVNSEPDEDGVVRKQFLLKTDSEGVSHTIMALKTAERFLGQQAIFKEKNSPLFCLEEVSDWNALITKLKKPENPQEKIIRDLLDEETQNILNSWNPGEKISMEMKLLLVNQLNNIVISETFYNASIWGSSPLPSEAAHFVEKGTENLTPDETMKLNRLLLESIFPNSLNKASDWQRTAVFLGAEEIPILDNYEMMVNYAGPSGTFTRGQSFGELVKRAKAGDKEYFRRRYRGKAVLIGPGYSGSTDILNTPYNILRYPEMYGIEGHANVLNTLLNRDYIKREKKATNILIAVLFSLIIAFACYYLKPGWSLLSSVVLVSVFAYVGLFMFYRHNIWMNISAPVLQVPLTFGITFIIKYITSDRKRAHIRKVLGRYVSEQVAKEILKDPSRLALGGERTEVTILFCDINDFTTMSEKKDPAEIINILNDYFDRMERVIFRHGGTLKQFVGDEIMVITGAPQPNPDHAFQMVKIALGMVDELTLWRESREKAGLESFDVKFGIHSGRVVAGNVGSARRTEYTTVGDVVNTTSRIMGLTKKYGVRVLISEETYNRVKDRVAVEKKGSSQVKGRESEVVVYELKGLKPWKMTEKADKK